VKDRQAEQINGHPLGHVAPEQDQASRPVKLPFTTTEHGPETAENGSTTEHEDLDSTMPYEQDQSQVYEARELQYIAQLDLMSERKHELKRNLNDMA